MSPNQQIDFLPKGYLADRQRKQTRKWHRSVLGVLALLLATGAVGERLQLSRHKAERDRLQRLVSANERNVGPQGAQAERLEQAQREAKLLTLLAMAPSRSHLLQAIASQTPESVTLKSITISTSRREHSAEIERQPRSSAAKRKSGKPSHREQLDEAIAALETALIESQLEIEVRGIADSDVAVSHYLAALERVELFEAVRLQYAQSEGSDDAETRLFAVRIHVRRTGAAIEVAAAVPPPLPPSIRRRPEPSPGTVARSPRHQSCKDRAWDV